MKAIRLWLVAVCTVIAFTLTAAAQNSNPTPTQQTVTGTSGAGFNTSGGNNDTGGFAAGMASADFKAIGPTTVNGSAQSAGTGTTQQTTDTTAATSASHAVMGSMGSADGALVTVHNNVQVGQGDWAGVSGNDVNLVNAGNVTGASASGAGDAHGSLTAQAAGDAQGNTSVKLNGVGTNDTSTTALTEGSSMANTTGAAKCLIGAPTISSKADGSGALNALSTVGDPKGTGAVSFVKGTADYTVNNPTGAGASGNLKIQGATSGKVEGTTVSAASSITATSTGIKH